jgi:hypothetical protein
MNAFIFVSIVCIGQQCNFFTSNIPISQTKCESIKKDFLVLPFKPEVTLAAAQCMTFNEGTKV